MLPARGAASHRRRRLAGGARAWGAIGALLVLAATLASAQQQQAPTAFADAPPAPAPVTMAANPSGCILTFDLANAPALVGGTITTEAGKPGSPLTTAGGVQVAGRLALQLATAACPRTWAELNATGLTGAKIVPTEEPTLRLLPAKLTAKVRGEGGRESEWANLGGGWGRLPAGGGAFVSFSLHGACLRQAPHTWPVAPPGLSLATLSDPLAGQPGVDGVVEEGRGGGFLVFYPRAVPPAEQKKKEGSARVSFPERRACGGWRESPPHPHRRSWRRAHG